MKTPTKEKQFWKMIKQLRKMFEEMPDEEFSKFMDWVFEHGVEEKTTKEKQEDIFQIKEKSLKKYLIFEKK